MFRWTIVSLVTMVLTILFVSMVTKFQIIYYLLFITLATRGLFITLATRGLFITIVTRGFPSNKKFISLATMGFLLVTVNFMFVSIDTVRSICFLSYDLYLGQIYKSIIFCVSMDFVSLVTLYSA